MFYCFFIRCAKLNQAVIIIQSNLHSVFLMHYNKQKRYPEKDVSNSSFLNIKSTCSKKILVLVLHTS